MIAIGIVGDFAGVPLQTAADRKGVGKYLRQRILPLVYRQCEGLPLRIWLVITGKPDPAPNGNGWVIRDSKPVVMELRVPSELEGRPTEFFYLWGREVATQLRATAAFVGAEAWIGNTQKHDCSKDLSGQPGVTSGIALTEEILGDDGRVQKTAWLCVVAGDGVGEFGPWRKGGGHGEMISILPQGLE